MNQLTEKQHYSDDEIDLREFFLTLWRGKWLILATTVFFVALGVAYALYKPEIYQASVLLAPAEDRGGNFGSVNGQIGGLASLAGISLGGGGSTQTIVAKEILQSRAFLSDFIKRHELAVPLMATSGWDSSSGTWLYNRQLYNPETGQWLSDEDGRSLQPGNWNLVKSFRQKHLSISENQDTGMITLSVKSQSPPAAQKWAELLVADINEHMRRKDVSESQARINYLEEKLEETNIAGMQQIFYQLIESETRIVMLANARKEYVFETVDPAVIPQEKSEPKRVIIVAISAVLGGMAGMFFVFIRGFMRVEEQRNKGA